MDAPEEPPRPAGRRPHRERAAEINRILPEGETAAICIDDTPEHRAWYLHELAKYPELVVEWHGVTLPGVYTIKVRKRPCQNE